MQMELDNDEDDHDWIDDDEEEECDNVPKRQLIAQSDWTNLESTFDDADGQTTGKVRESSAKLSLTSLPFFSYHLP